MVAEEVRAVTTAVGLTEVNGFNRIEITGTDRHAFLDRMMCGKVARRTGKVGLGYLLNDHGMVKAEATIANIPASERGPDRVWYGSAAASELHDMDWLTSHLRPDEDVSIRSLTNDHTILVLAGPRARDVLKACSRDDWSNAAFPWLSVRERFVGIAPATVMSVSYSGELAFEIHVPNAPLYTAFLALTEAGADYGLKLFGARAVESMRLEKGYLHWKTDLLTEFDPYETGLDRFVSIDKSDFIGREALLKRRADGPRRRLVTLEVDRADAPARGGASVMYNGAVAGTVTSGDWGHRSGLNLALAFLEPGLAALGSELTIDILGERTPAKVIPSTPFDPDTLRPRA